MLTINTHGGKVYYYFKKGVQGMATGPEISQGVIGAAERFGEWAVHSRLARLALGPVTVFSLSVVDSPAAGAAPRLDAQVVEASTSVQAASFQESPNPDCLSVESQELCVSKKATGNSIQPYTFEWQFIGWPDNSQNGGWNFTVDAAREYADGSPYPGDGYGWNVHFNGGSTYTFDAPVASSSQPLPPGYYFGDLNVDSANADGQHASSVWYYDTEPPAKPNDCAMLPGGFRGETSAIAAVNGGYYVTDALGQVCAFGAANYYGDLVHSKLSSPIIGMTATPDGGGYWLLGADGGVFSFGDAHFYGSTGGWRLNAPVVSMSATQDGEGYWLIAKDGGVFSFGDAGFHGSTGNIKLAKPVDGLAVAPEGNGYWLVAEDGGVFTFTNKGFYGSLGGVALAKPIIGMAGTADGKGYTLVGQDGGVFNFGDSHFYGSLGNNPPVTPVVDLSPAPTNDGYYLVDSGGEVFNFGPGTANYGNPS